MESNIKNTYSFEKHLNLRFAGLLLLQLISLCLFCAASNWPVTHSLSIALPIMVIAIWQSKITIAKIRSILCVLVNSLEHINSSNFNTSPHLPYKSGVLNSLNIEYAKLQSQLRHANFSRQKDAYVMYQLLEQLDTPIFLFDHAKRLVNANPKSMLFLGRDWRLVKGESFENLGFVLAENHQIVCREKNDIWTVKSCVSTSKDNKFYLVVLQNIEQALRAKERSAWYQLIKVIGHEVRNSLTPIYALSNALADDFKEDKNKHEALSVIAARSKSLQSFVNRTTELAHIPTPVIEPIDIKLKLEEVCNLLPNIHYNLQVNAPIAHADPVQLEQVLVNLVKNADEAMPEKGVVSILTYETNQGCQIEISDRGTGIYEQNNLFVPFYTTKESGSGIGLALSKQLVEAHNGKISIKNNADDVGVTVSLWLPYTLT